MALSTTMNGWSIWVDAVLGSIVADFLFKKVSL
jgi:hypothetical protein